MDGDIKNILVTGPPGCGKTTLIRKIVTGLPASISRAGFLTGDLREGNRRVGFEIRTLDGRKGILSHVRFDTGYRVGKYGVDVSEFERLVLPVLASSDVQMVVIDEIGKMECLSKEFCRMVEAVLRSGPVCLGSIALKGGGLIGDIRSRNDVEIIQVTLDNRDSLLSSIAERIIKLVASWFREFLPA